MSVDTTSPRTRRSVLAAALGAVGALVATGLARPAPVSAHDSDDVQLGGNVIQDETGITWIRNQGTDSGGMQVEANGGGVAFGATYRGTGGLAVQGFNYHGTGIEGYAYGTVQTGVRGRSSGGTGVVGFSGPNSATAPATLAKTGVYGVASQGTGAIGVYGQSATGRGGQFKGKLANLRLPPSGAATHPHAGQPGDLFVDSSYRLWFCKGGASWTRIA